MVEYLYSRAPSTQFGGLHGVKQQLWDCGMDKIPMQVNRASKVLNLCWNVNSLVAAVSAVSGGPHVGFIEHGSALLSYSYRGKSNALTGVILSLSGSAGNVDSLLCESSSFSCYPFISLVVGDFDVDSRTRFVIMFYEKECTIEENNPTEDIILAPNSIEAYNNVDFELEKRGSYGSVISLANWNECTVNDDDASSPVYASNSVKQSDFNPTSSLK